MQNENVQDADIITETKKRWKASEQEEDRQIGQEEEGRRRYYSEVEGHPKSGRKQLWFLRFSNFLTNGILLSATQIRNLI